MVLRALAVPLSIAVVVGLAGCDPLGGGDAGGAPGAVQVAVAEPRHLLPTNTNDADGAQVLSALFAPLVAYDEHNRPYEVAAEYIEWTRDHRVWTIKLKDGFTFHDGERVTADSYINAWNYGAYAPNNQANGYLFGRIAGYADTQPTDPDGAGPEPATDPAAKTLSGLEKVDDLTVRVTLSAPFTEFMSMLGTTAFYPLPSSAWQSPGVLKPGFEDAIVGQGPFKLTGGWKRGEPIQVARYEPYAGDKPKVPALTFRPYTQLTAAYGDLLDGDLDVLRTLPTERLADAASDLGDRRGQRDGSTLQMLAFPMYQPEFAKAEVRRAISMAIDRDALVRTVFDGAQLPARAFVSPVVPGYRPDSCTAACAFDPEAAKRLYAEAGGPATLRITYNDDGGHQEWIEATCAQLRANLGVTCEPVTEPRFADLLTRVAKREPVGLFRMAWPMDYPSMENYLTPLYSMTGSSNYAGYRNAEFDTLLTEATRGVTEAEMQRKYRQAEDLLAKDMPVIPLRFSQYNYGYSAKVRNVKLDLFGNVDLVALESTS
ncbi:ABC transporter substrate-binding protein [Actinomycetes bacterium KLBMP 9797]